MLNVKLLSECNRNMGAIHNRINDTLNEYIIRLQIKFNASGAGFSNTP